tara:strand:- start:157 stop:513 length:357 start_codon:yes stop_codon:yes gene_type:complete
VTVKENDRFSPEGEPKKIYVDIDETICFFPDKRLYTLAVPDKDNIAKINKLYDEGNIITYWTARGASQPSNKKRFNEYKSLTEKQLVEWGCKFHFLEMGNKPSFDLLIDDKTKRIEEI